MKTIYKCRIVAVIIIASLFCANLFCNKQTTEFSSAKDSVSFIVLGDWGNDGLQYQKPVSEQMNKFANLFNVQFIITTGDNFYPNGVKSVTDPKWQTSFENIYNQDALMVKWNATLGNHDYSLNPQAEVEYTSKSARWNMPARYYSQKKCIDLKDSILFVFTDTSPFVADYYKESAGMPDIKKQDTAAQLLWINETLRKSKDKWKFVIGHHPVYSAGGHGNTPELIKKFKPIFNTTKTDFYLSGHDHSLQYLKNPDEALYYMVSAGGCEMQPLKTNANAVFAKSSPGFLLITVYSEKVNFYFCNEKGEIIYQNQISK